MLILHKLSKTLPYASLMGKEFSAFPSYSPSLERSIDKQPVLKFFGDNYFFEKKIHHFVRNLPSWLESLVINEVKLCEFSCKLELVTFKSLLP